MQLREFNLLAFYRIRIWSFKNSQALIDPKHQGPYTNNSGNKDTTRRTSLFSTYSHAEVNGSQL